MACVVDNTKVMAKNAVSIMSKVLFGETTMKRYRFPAFFIVSRLGNLMCNLFSNFTVNVQRFWPAETNLNYAVRKCLILASAAGIVVR